MNSETALIKTSDTIIDRSKHEMQSRDFLGTLDQYVETSMVPELLAALTTISTGDSTNEWAAIQERLGNLTVSSDVDARLQRIEHSSDTFIARWASLLHGYLVTPDESTKEIAIEEARHHWSIQYQLLHHFRTYDGLPDPPEHFAGGDAVKDGMRGEKDTKERKKFHMSLYSRPQELLSASQRLRNLRNEASGENFAIDTLQSEHDMTPGELQTLIQPLIKPAIDAFHAVITKSSKKNRVGTPQDWDTGYLSDSWENRLFHRVLGDRNVARRLTHTSLPRTPEIDHTMTLLAQTLGFSRELASIHVDNRQRIGKQLDRAININAPFAVAVVLNQRKGTTMFNYLIPFREFGHALHFSMIDPSLPYVMRQSDSAWTEGVGEQVMTHLAIEQLARKYNTPELSVLHTVSDLGSRFACLQYLEFELAWYQTEENPLTLAERIYQKYFPFIQEPNPMWWAVNRYIAEYPLYCANYILADTIASQIIHYGKTHFKDILSPEFGTFLREMCYKPGRSKPWQQLLKEATGEPVNSKYYLQDMWEAMRQLPKL